MAKFCGKCGSKLDEATKLCPVCDAEKIEGQSEELLGTVGAVTEESAEPAERPDSASEQLEVASRPASVQSETISKEEIKKEAKEKRKLEKKKAKIEKTAQKKAERWIRKKEKWITLTFSQKVKHLLLKFILRLLLLVLLVGGVSVALTYFDLIDVPYVKEAMQFMGIERGGS